MRVEVRMLAVRAITWALPAILAGCGGGSEPLRRIEALEARVERLEQATLPGPRGQGVPAVVEPDSAR